jgi:hypothetical protein
MPRDPRVEVKFTNTPEAELDRLLRKLKQTVADVEDEVQKMKAMLTQKADVSHLEMDKGTALPDEKGSQL